MTKVTVNKKQLLIWMLLWKNIVSYINLYNITILQYYTIYTRIFDITVNIDQAGSRIWLLLNIYSLKHK